MRFGEKLAAVEEYRPFPYQNQIRLDANESPFSFPEALKKEIFAEISAVDFNRYPDPEARELCRAFASYYGVQAENTVAGNGSDELLSVIFGGILSEKDKVLVTAPDFSMYRIYCETYGRSVEIYEKNGDFSLDVKDLCRVIREKGVTFLIFSNPCNPTGGQVSREDVLWLVKNAGCTVCVDEAYMDFSCGSIMDAVTRVSNLIVLKTMSKNIGFAAGRIGFAVSSVENIAVFKKAKSPYNVNSLSQAAGTAIFRNGDFLREVTAKIIASGRALSSALKKFETVDFRIYSSQANFVYVQSERAGEIYSALLENHIVVRCFGGRYLRITAGTEEENAALCRALEKIFTERKR